MLTLITGVPGAGKTLYTLGLAEKYRAEGRTVWHNGINGLALPWEVLDPSKSWEQVPDGAVVVLDEAQQIWRVRPQGSKVPPDVAALETHRHRGIDILLTTQAPGLIDTNVRKLVGCHYHLTRKYGREKVGVYRWESCQSSPDGLSVQNLAFKEMWSFPKEHFSWYQSATAHTHKKQFPYVLVAKLAGAAVVVGVSVAGAFWLLGKPAREAAEVVQAEAVPVPFGQGEAGPMKVAETRGDPWQPELRQARYSGLPATAKYYDSFFHKPASAPIIAGCAELMIAPGPLRCDCFTDQGAKVDVTISQCQHWLRFGSHDTTKARQDVNKEVIARLNAAGAGGGGGAGAAGAPATAAPEPKPSAVSMN
jgi:hypothetical protein